MDIASPLQRQRPFKITLPQRSLIVLCGPAGAGKSTFAQHLVHQNLHAGFAPSMVISSDYCRRIIFDDETNQQANRETFDLFHFIITKRMLQNRPTIADSTALTWDARHKLLELAHRHNYLTCLFIFNISPEICLRHEQQRQRRVGIDVINYHFGQLQNLLSEYPREGWHQVYQLSEADINAPEANIHLTILPSPPANPEA
ncbi:AAA family ATPase [Ktedonospora formicarum]|uniref:ATP-binding protein n=1 Tax=Ktedonospora formicarum TaxID=2778364 RepID=A0A8J3I0M0_9CHLR|nr:AAA family ATPase [Ktedonospora formicarum]GHO43908.1 hypothetical protein KSX_20710 [Ktedonospora formicarum]